MPAEEADLLVAPAAAHHVHHRTMHLLDRSEGAARFCPFSNPGSVLENVAKGLHEFGLGHAVDLVNIHRKVPVIVTVKNSKRDRPSRPHSLTKAKSPSSTRVRLWGKVTPPDNFKGVVLQTCGSVDTPYCSRGFSKAGRNLWICMSISQFPRSSAIACVSEISS